MRAAAARRPVSAGIRERARESVRLACFRVHALKG